MRIEGLGIGAPIPWKDHILMNPSLRKFPFQMAGFLCLVLTALMIELAAAGEPAGSGFQPTDDSAAETSPQNKAAPVVSGREIGDYVPTFYTRAVTGPLMNRSVCYVCRNGGRPVVMVFLRKFGAEVKPLLKQVDSLVDDHRADGLRSFGVFVTKDPSEAISEVQTFSFDNKIALPLTVASDAIAEPHCQNLNAQAEVTVVLYNKRRVVNRFAFREGEIQSDEVAEVAQAITRLLGD